MTRSDGEPQISQGLWSTDLGRRAAEAAFRVEWPRLVAGLTRMTGDIGTAEDLAQDAMLAAVEQWPRDGVPVNPGGWLMVTAKHRAIDRLRRDTTFARKLPELGRQLAVEDAEQPLSPDLGPDSAIGDDLLRMVFIACHPVLSPQARVALTLRMVGGLTTQEIARAYLVPEPTVAQRIVRAKRTLAAQRIPFAVPNDDDLAPRLDSALEVIYLIFNEGYQATAGDEWVRADLADEGLRLARTLAELMPQEPEVHGLAALLELQASRIRARRGGAGELVVLADQNRSRWDQLLVRRGFAALARAQTLNRTSRRAPGRYTLQAAIAAAHAMAVTPDQTDWRRIADLYALLAQQFPSPIVELNRAVAVAMVEGPDAGLELLEAVTETGALSNYHLLHAVRGDLLARLGRHQEAATAFAFAATRTANTVEQHYLRDRASTELVSTGSGRQDEGVADNRLFELRTYHAAPGKLDALQARFANHTMRLFDKHGLEVVGFWVARDENGQPGNDLVYVLAFPDSEAREKAWDTFRADPDWIKARAESEADGPLLISLESVLLDPTSYSPLS